MLNYPEHKPNDYGTYEVQLVGGTLTTAKWNGCGWVIYLFNTTVIKFNPKNLDSKVQIWTFNKLTKQLEKTH